MSSGRSVRKLKTRVPELDDLLGGGLETQAITEMYGEFGSGKSQIVHQMAVNVQLPEDEGGLSGSAIYIDTENTFRPERIEQMVIGLGIDADPQEFLENIHVARAHTSDHQMLMMDTARERAAEMRDIRPAGQALYHRFTHLALPGRVCRPRNACRTAAETEPAPPRPLQTGR